MFCQSVSFNRVYLVETSLDLVTIYCIVQNTLRAIQYVHMLLFSFLGLTFNNIAKILISTVVAKINNNRYYQYVVVTDKNK